MQRPRHLSISPCTGLGFLGRTVPCSITNLSSLRRCHSSQAKTDCLAQQVLPGFSKHPSQDRVKVSRGQSEGGGTEIPWGHWVRWGVGKALRWETGSLPLTLRGAFPVLGLSFPIFSQTRSKERPCTLPSQPGLEFLD